MNKSVIIVCLCFFICSGVFAQTHNSVLLDNRIYYILEQAELRGLCSPLPITKPYTQYTITTIIKEILENSAFLNNDEQAVLQEYLDKFSNNQNGFDAANFNYRNETTIGNGVPLSFNAGAGISIEGSAGLYNEFNENYFGTEIWVEPFLSGDIGKFFSWAVNGGGGLIQAPRNEISKYWTYYEPYDPVDADWGYEDSKDGQYVNQPITVYSEPLTHFPYTYRKRWDGSIHSFSSLNSYRSWPGTMSIGYNFLPEVNSSFFNNKLTVRIGRISREWGSASFGSSLAFNQAARPFLGYEAEFAPVSWLDISTITGSLEYFNSNGIKKSSSAFQNMFSMTMVQFRYKNYLFLDIGEMVVAPKRFELGYLFPLMSNVITQLVVGDFDNIAVLLNVKAQYPGIGSIWFSLFGDEAGLYKNANELDRTMIAWQAGVNLALPFLSFSSVKISYTKVNPYCYTHNRNFNPWYGNIPMETSYTNNGVSLGYYLPPNSDEILVSLNTMPVKNLSAGLQYQLIRHGADFGPNSVDGSNLLSELDPAGRDTNPVLKRFFLHDGAYQWSHIVRLNFEYSIPGLPAAVFGEAGVNFSYFTDTAGNKSNSGRAYPYSRINTDDYPESTGFIFKLGVRIFPK